MNLARTLRTLAIAVVIAAALASGAKAYTTYSSWGTLNVSFYVNPANLDVSQNAALSALQAGMRVWNEQSGTGFRFNYAGQVSTTTTGYDDKNMIVFRNDRDGSKIASTYSWTSNGLLKDTDIVFWDAARTFFTGTSGCTSGGAYIEDIAAHELGHALGLQHSSVADATMYGTYPSCSQGMRTLSADDIAAVQALYAEGPGEADTPPSVSVLSPDNGATVTASTTITFSGSATDTTDGDISGDLTWRSNISGHIGSGASFSRTLPAGSHTISATVTDSIGFTITRAIVLTVTSGAANTAPSVTISSPASGGTVAAGTLVTFRGSASDTQDGSLTSSLAWRSNLDGPIGTGGSFTRALTAGTHTLTASVTDSGGLTTSRFITVNSTAPAPPPPPPTPPPAPPTTPPAPTPPPTPPPAVPPPSPTVGTLTVTGHTAGANRKAVLSWGGLTATSVDIYRNGMKVRTTENDGVMTDQINGLVRGSYNYKVCVTGTSTCTSQATVTF